MHAVVAIDEDDDVGDGGVHANFDVVVDGDVVQMMMLVCDFDVNMDGVDYDDVAVVVIDAGDFDVDGLVVDGVNTYWWCWRFFCS